MIFFYNLPIYQKFVIANHTTDIMGLPLSARQRPLKKHSLNFTIDSLHNNDDPWHIKWIMFNVLNDYLQPNSKLSDNEAARCLGAIMPGNRPAMLGEDEEHVHSWMKELSGLIWDIVRQIPCDHEGQDKLIRLLSALRRLPITQTIYDYRGLQVSAWNGLDHWHDTTRDFVRYPKKRDSPHQQTCDYYVNAMAFVARVHAAGVQFPLYCVVFSTMGRAVDGLVPDDEILPCHLIAGAQWVVLATEWMWSNIRWGKCDFHELEEDGTKDMANQPAQWVRWLRGFEKVARTGEQGSEIKYWADLAVAKMKGMMSTKGFNVKTMEAWNAEEHSLWDYMWEDRRYAHLFKVPDKD